MYACVICLAHGACVVMVMVCVCVCVCRDLVPCVAVCGQLGDHPLQQSGSRLQEAASLHLPRRQWDCVCPVTHTYTHTLCPSLSLSLSLFSLSLSVHLSFSLSLSFPLSLSLSLSHTHTQILTLSLHPQEHAESCGGVDGRV